MQNRVRVGDGVKVGKDLMLGFNSAALSLSLPHSTFCVTQTRNSHTFNLTRNVRSNCSQHLYYFHILELCKYIKGKRKSLLTFSVTKQQLRHSLWNEQQTQRRYMHMTFVL